MLGSLVPTIQNGSGWALGDVDRFIRSRLRAYDTWMCQKDRPDPLWHVAKFFAACCQDLRIEVEWNAIVPDMDEFEQIPGANPEFVKQMRNVEVEHSPPAYPLNVLVVGSLIEVMVSAADKIDRLLG